MSFDVVRELRRAKAFAAAMLLVTAFGMVAFDDNIVFVILALNTTVWLVRFWYFTTQLYEHSLIQDERLHGGDR